MDHSVLFEMLCLFCAARNCGSLCVLRGTLSAGPPAQVPSWPSLHAVADEAFGLG